MFASAEIYDSFYVSTKKTFKKNIRRIGYLLYRFKSCLV